MSENNDKIKSDKSRWICPGCGSDNIDFMVNIYISAPINKYWGNLSKRAFRSKEVEIWGVDWTGRTIICQDCQSVISDGRFRQISTNPQDTSPNGLFSERLHSCPVCDGRGYGTPEDSTPPTE